jgi:hypothetical protein
MPQPQLDLFRPCAVSGCEWSVFAPEPEDDARCPDHGGQPIAAYLESPFGEGRYVVYAEPGPDR